MHSTLTRIQTVFGFFTTVAFAISALVWVSTFPSTETPRATISKSQVKVLNTYPQRGYITFDADIDLSSLYNWNTRQVFVYVKATYPSRSADNKHLNEAIIWDAILPAKNAFEHENYRIPVSDYNTDKSDVENNPGGSAGKKKRPRRTPGLIKLRNQRPKYWVSDPTGVIATRENVTLSVGYSVQPWIGPTLRMRHSDFGRWHALDQGVSEPFRVPDTGNVAVSAGSVRTVKGKEKNKGRPI